jgi:hypothetical protein
MTAFRLGSRPFGGGGGVPGLHCGGFGRPDCVADVSVAQRQSALRQAVVGAQTVASAAMRPMGEGHPDCTADVLVARTAPRVFRSPAGEPHCTAVLLSASLQKFVDLASAAARPLRQGCSDCAAEVSVARHRAALQSSSALLLLIRAHRREHRGPIAAEPLHRTVCQIRSAASRSRWTPLRLGKS